jgi:hypothetical protein
MSKLFRNINTVLIESIKNNFSQSESLHGMQIAVSGQGTCVSHHCTLWNVTVLETWSFACTVETPRTGGAIWISTEVVVA